MPAKSEKQAIAARIARGIQKGEVKPKAGTASAEMAKMPAKSLKHFTKTETSMPKLSDMAKKVMEANKPSPLMLNGKEVERGSLEIDGVDPKDYPDFSDAYIAAGNYTDGTPLTDKEIAQLEDENYGLTNDLAHGSYLQEGDYDWRDDPKLSRDWEKSDVSQDEFERSRRLGRYRSHVPSTMKGITFFNVPAGKEDIALRKGLAQFKSGKWGYKHYSQSLTNNPIIKSIEMEFGPGRYWEPKN